MDLARELPAYFKPFLSAHVAKLKVSENELDCLNCSMGPAGPNVKCCAYRPFIANFQIFELHADLRWKPLWEEPELLPLGLMASVRFQVNRTGDEENFLCPFFTKNKMCAIWSKRPAPCATYFCRSSQGEKGRAFWRAAEDLLVFIEQALSAVWMLQAGYSWDEVQANRQWLAVQEGACENLTADRQNQLWAHHNSNRLDYFKRAQAWAATLTPEDLQKWLGLELNGFEQAVLEKHRLTSWAGSLRANA